MPSELENVDIHHIMSKGWKDYKNARDFFLAYLSALNNAGYKYLNINIKSHFNQEVI